jgi:SDR family mycofactocin-dependent oxidoreductase
MAGRFEGKVAFITGAARGQGRSHAVRLAEEGADIIAIDIARQIECVPYPMPGPEDLKETVRQVEALGRGIVARVGDVRDPEALQDLVTAGVDAFGRIDIIIPNAGIAPHRHDEKDPLAVWNEVLSVNLTGVYNSVHAALPVMIDRGEGGSVVLISSITGSTGRGGTSNGSWEAYTTSKHGVIGLMRVWANWLAPHSIRVNAVQPTGVRTPMVVNDSLPEIFEKRPETATALTNLPPVDIVELEDITNAVTWLASDEARYVTGISLPVDAGFLAK